MEKEFVPYAEALALKKLGFDELCLASFETETNWHMEHRPWRNSEDPTEIASPLYQQAFRWFREKYNLEITTNIIVSKSFSTLPINKTYSFVIVKTDEVSTERINKSVGMRMDIATPEELNIQALDKLIEIAKKINIGLRI